MTTNTIHHLLDDYLRDGVVGPIDVLTVEEATEMKNAFVHDFLVDSYPTDPSHPNDAEHQPLQYHQANDDWFKTHLFVPWVNRIVRHPNLIRAVQEVLQSDDIRCWSCDFNVRHSGADTMIAPHQDATYAGLHPADQVVTAWVALSDPVTLHEGGLIFYPGSLLLGQLPHTTDYDGIHVEDDTRKKEDEGRKLRNVLSRRQRCALPTHEGTSIPLRAGQATLHHFYCVHASGPNHSPSPRIGLAIRYMTAVVRRSHFTVPESITWISGNLDVIHKDCFLLEPILPDFPTPEQVQRGKVAHREAMERERTNYFSAPLPVSKSM
jgi:non-heme Fe2+,alpha-ketoglutarate-dependent halogenase